MAYKNAYERQLKISKRLKEDVSLARAHYRILQVTIDQYEECTKVLRVEIRRLRTLINE